MIHQVKITDNFSGDRGTLRRIEPRQSIGAFARNLKVGMKVLAINLVSAGPSEVTVVEIGARINISDNPGESNYIMVTVEDGE